VVKKGPLRLLLNPSTWKHHQSSHDPSVMPRIQYGQSNKFHKKVQKKKPQAPTHGRGSTKRITEPIFPLIRNLTYNGMH